MSVRRDYKPDSSWNSRRKVRVHAVVVIALALIGLIGGVVAYFGGGKPETELANNTRPVERGAQDVRAVRKSEPISLPLPEPKYDFYNVLPKRQVEIPKEEITNRDLKALQEPPRSATAAGDAGAASKPAQSKAAAGAQDKGPAESRTASGYVIQVGSFRNYADADKVKASLALIGIRARIETGTGGGSAALHRVRIGPIRDPGQVQALRQRLQANNIQSIAIRSD